MTPAPAVSPRIRSRRLPLVADTVRGHRWGTLAWVVATAVGMYAIAAGFASEVARFPGGARGMAESMQAGVNAMRLLRWPADRLDTLGGYLTYHNLTLFTLGLCVYAAIQGARAVRGAETDGVPALILAAGRSRPQLLLGRSAGFAATLVLICAGWGAALALAMAAGGEPDAGGSFVTALDCGLAALAAYALGVLVSQLAPSARAGTALAGLLVTGLYLLTNVWQEIGAFGLVRFISPFFYWSRSRALIPGHDLDVGAACALLATSVLMLILAARIYLRRDYAAGLWTPAARRTHAVRPVQRRALRSVWSAALLRQRAGLLAWALSAAAALAMMGWLEPQVADMWDDFQYTRRVMPVEPGQSVADAYLSLAGQFVVPIVTAYVVVQASGWVADLRDGRVELLLSAPLSWSALVAQRLLATMLGAALMTLAALAGLAGSAWAVDAEVDGAGLVRLAADTLLFTAAITGVAALVVAWLRRGAAVAALTVLIGASYLLGYLVALFDWPDWLNKASLFGAYGNPYLETPPTAGLLVLAGTALAGTGLALLVARGSAKAAI